MNKTLKLAVAFAGAFFVGLVALTATKVPPPENDEIENRVNANLLQVRVNGKWHDVPMIGLSDHLCDSNHPMFRRYCD